MYNKLFTKILDSSIWLAPDPHRLIWITLIAAMDENGIATFACAENLAVRARVSLEQTEQAIKAFESPDAHDPEQEHEGRRIERIPGGWLILNAEKYRKLITRSVANEQARLRMAKHREKLRNVTQPFQPVTPSYAVSESDAGSEKRLVSRKRSTDVPRETSDAEKVFEHWKLSHSHPRAQLDPKRLKIIQAALRRYSVADLCLSITGYLNSPHHMGDNDRQTVYDDIDLMLRDAKHIDAGLKFQSDPPHERVKPSTNVQAAIKFLGDSQ